MVDVSARLEIIQRRARPAFTFGDGAQAAKTQRFTNAGLIDHETGNAPLGELFANGEIDHLLDAIEAVAKHHAGPRASAVSPDETCGKALALVRYLDALAIEGTGNNRALHDLQHRAVSVLARRIVTALHAFRR